MWLATGLGQVTGTVGSGWRPVPTAGRPCLRQPPLAEAQLAASWRPGWPGRSRAGDVLPRPRSGIGDRRPKSPTPAPAWTAAPTPTREGASPLGTHIGCGASAGEVSCLFASLGGQGLRIMCPGVSLGSRIGLCGGGSRGRVLRCGVCLRCCLRGLFAGWVSRALSVCRPSRLGGGRLAS